MRIIRLVGYIRGFRGIEVSAGVPRLGEPQDERTERGCIRRFDGG